MPRWCTCATAAPMNRAFGTRETCSSASTGCRSSTSRIHISRCAGVPRTRRAGMCWSSTARSTTTWNSGRHWPPNMAPYSPPRATARRSWRRTTSGGRTRYTGCAACSRSRSGTPWNASCSAPAILSVSSRCSWRPARAAPHSAARRNACWISSNSWASRPSWTCARCSITRRCNTFRSPRACTPRSAAWNPVRTPASPPDRSRASRATSRPDSRWPRSRVPRVSPGTTRSPRCSPIRWPSICART
ncbi:Uncharacterised protein [Mycobacteroides abscessus]|nr:Uncharacterised protein [Mycobacteroides abscessus]CQA08401.1 Uncharacterised protein [Mycobacteroides abscessus]